MSKLSNDIALKLKGIEKKKKERAARKERSKRLVASTKRQRIQKLISSPPDKKIPQTYTEAKAVYGTIWYAEWREGVFKRDDYQCQMCGTKGSPLEAHHIRPKYKFPELTLEKDNGIALCKECHQTRVTRYEHLFYFIFDRIVKANRSK